MIRLLIIGDIRLSREGLAVALGRHGDFEQVATAGDVGAALDIANAKRPDVILVDLTMADALAIPRALAQSPSGAVLIALTVPDAET